MGEIILLKHSTERTWNSTPWMVDYLDLMMAHSVKNLPQCTRPGSVPVSARSLGEGNDYSLQYSCLEISMDKGASVQFSHSVVSDYLWPHRPWSGFPVHHQLPELLKLTSIESVMPSNHLILCRVPFSSCLQSFPLSGSFQMSQFCASGGQRIRTSASASVLAMNIQDCFPLE